MSFGESHAEGIEKTRRKEIKGRVFRRRTYKAVGGYDDQLQDELHLSAQRSTFVYGKTGYSGERGVCAVCGRIDPCGRSGKRPVQGRNGAALIWIFL